MEDPDQFAGPADHGFASQEQIGSPVHGILDHGREYLGLNTPGGTTDALGVGHVVFSLRADFRQSAPVERQIRQVAPFQLANIHAHIQIDNTVGEKVMEKHWGTAAFAIFSGNELVGFVQVLNPQHGNSGQRFRRIGGLLVAFQLMGLPDDRLDLRRVQALADGFQPLGWQLALDLLVPLAHWVTPATEPRRFDTRFYLAPLPPGQEATACRRETVGGDWVAPTDALARHARGEITLAPPTHRTLDDLAACADMEAARSLASSLPYVRIEPRAHREGDENWLLLPGDPLYPAPPGAGLRPPTRFVAAGRHRFVPLGNP